MITAKKTQITLLLSAFLLCGYSSNAEVTYAKTLNGREHQIGSLLNWSTATEFNNQVFIIEKSVNGIDFQAIGEVEAVGNASSERGYRFLDVGASDKNTYYRLRQVDMDGTASFSETIKITKKLSNNFMVMAMSNTVTNSTFDISIDATIDNEIAYIVKNRQGEVVIESKEELFFGINEISINLTDEAEGTYFVILKVKDEVEKLVIRKVDDEIKAKENVASKRQSNGG